MQHFRGRVLQPVVTPLNALIRRKFTMARHQEINKTYQDTMIALNGLQSNAATLLAAEQNRSHNYLMERLKMVLVQLEATGAQSSELNRLSVIHVTGTKGKGSTCSLCETILRKNGYKTGLFSSPHLVSVRERIHINGKPLEENQFVKYFWEVMEPLRKFKDTEVGLPHYFNFTFLMAIKAFLEEQVDVAVIEVGIGGQYDATNILPNVDVVGISNLGLDHTRVLGSTIAEIAWQKAGIMKPCAVAFTVPDQDPKAMEVLEARSAELKCPLTVVPSLDKLTWPNNNVKNAVLKLPTVVQTNVALAVQLTEAWIVRKGNRETNTLPSLKVGETTAEAVQTWSLPGRMQTLPGDENITYFLDGAHTPESMAHCIDWFRNVSKNLGGNRRQVLICNITGPRDLKSILSPLYTHPFSDVFFTPNIAELNDNTDGGERWYAPGGEDTAKKRLLEMEVLWYKARALDVAPFQNVTKVRCVAEALREIKLLSRESEGIKYHVLVSGSLHLVGCALSVLDPTLERSYGGATT